MLSDVYASEDAFAAHQETEHFKKLVLERAVCSLERVNVTDILSLTMIEDASPVGRWRVRR
jgi:quinol monooxygenase YgiN